MVSLNTLFILVFGKWDVKGISQNSVVLQRCESARRSSVITELLSSPPAFCPYHIGHFSVVGLGLEDCVSAQPCILSRSSVLVVS